MHLQHNFFNIENLQLSELEIKLLFALRVLLENNLSSNSDIFTLDDKKYKILITNTDNINIIIKEK